MPDNQSAVPVSQRAREAAGGNNPVTDRAREIVKETMAKSFYYRIWPADAEDNFTKAIADILAGQSVPEGYVLVPKVPTGEMIRSAQVPDDRIATAIWSAMLAATPASDSPAIPDGMKPWHGGDSAPEDWDGGPVILRGGWIMDPSQVSLIHHPQGSKRWDHDRPNRRPERDIIAYTPKPTPASPAIPEGMEERPFAYCCAEAGGGVEACDCVNKNHGTALFSIRKPTPASHTAPDALREAIQRLQFNADFQRGYGSDDFYMRRDDADIILTALATPAPSRDEVEREALESALRALAIDSTPIIRRLARIQIKAALNKDTGDVQ